LLRDDPQYHDLASQVHKLALYREAADALGIAVPAAMRRSTLQDGRVWDGSDPTGYARSFDLHALAERQKLAL
jgi:nitrate/nitrite transport system substrate-binding protein